MNRRELLVGASMLVCGACATMPGRFERLPEGSTERAKDRVCDHDLCRYWRPPDRPVQSEGEFKVGQCSIGLPEDL